MRRTTRNMVPLADLDVGLAGLRAAITPWIGTPHRAGQSTPGAGVDCVHLVVEALDEWYQRCAPGVAERLRLDRPAQDLGLHDSRAARRTVSLILSRYPLRRVIVAGAEARTASGVEAAARRIRPGDIMSVRFGRGENHAMIACWSGASLWHAITGGVVSRSALGDGQLIRVIDHTYRPCAPRRSAA